MSYNILKALANPVRLKIITCLASGPKNVGELIRTCGLAQSAVSQHLKKLRAAGLVTIDRHGRTIFYVLADTQVAKVSHQIQSYLAKGSQ